MIGPGTEHLAGAGIDTTLAGWLPRGIAVMRTGAMDSLARAIEQYRRSGRPALAGTLDRIRRWPCRGPRPRARCGSATPAQSSGISSTASSTRSNWPVACVRRRRRRSAVGAGQVLHVAASCWNSAAQSASVRRSHPGQPGLALACGNRRREPPSARRRGHGPSTSRSRTPRVPPVPTFSGNAQRRPVRLAFRATRVAGGPFEEPLLIAEFGSSRAARG